MAINYRDIYINCGLTVFTTAIISQSKVVLTENDITRLLVDFPDNYGTDYKKIIDIKYLPAGERNYITESYEMAYDNTSSRYYFLINRKFAYGEEIQVQFRVRFTDGQEAVDGTILTFNFKSAIKRENLDIIDSDPTDEQTTILQGMVDEHSGILASTAVLGHVRIDDTTVKINEYGQIYSTFSEVAEAVISKPDGTISVFTTSIGTVVTTYSDICYVLLDVGTEFNLSYIGVSNTEDVWFRMMFGTEQISAEMLSANRGHNQFYFPYGFIRVEGDGVTYLTLQAKAVASTSQISAEFAGGPD